MLRHPALFHAQKLLHTHPQVYRLIIILQQIHTYSTGGALSTAIGLELDWELLAGEMEAPHCESPHHLDDDAHDDGPATHYMLIGHCCFGPIGQVIPVCGKYALHWAQTPPAPVCSWCNSPLDPMQLNQVIGPIN